MSPKSQKNTIKVLDLEVFTGPITEIKAIHLSNLENSSRTTPSFLACLNPHSYILAKENKAFYSALKFANYLVVDGVGLQFFLQLFSRQKVHRNTGMDCFISILQTVPKDRSANVFFIGSTEDVLIKIRKRFRAEFPNLTFAGSYSPTFNDEWDEREVMKMQKLLSDNNVDIVFVGLTAPKQEILIAQFFMTTQCKIVAAIGAVFDYYAETKPYPNKFVRKLGLEWLQRLVLEPKRMWKRTFISGPKFIYWILRERLKSLGQ